MGVKKEIDDVGGVKDNRHIPILCVVITCNVSHPQMLGIIHHPNPIYK
jgi:hypothetical protein